MGRFDGRTAIVTGAAAGIGEGLVAALLEEGARVVANDIDQDGLDALAGDERVVTVAGDTSDPDTARLLVEAAGDTIDVLFNNAAVFLIGPAGELSLEDWLRAVDVNLNGYFYVARAVGAKMVEQRSGSIVNLASTAGLLGIPNAVSYVTTKHGVVGLTKALAVEWACYGVRVNALCPGITETPMVQAFAAQDPTRYAERVERVPLGRAAGVPEQVALALALAASDSGYVTGVALPVDGGTTALSSGFAAPKA